MRKFVVIILSVFWIGIVHGQYSVSLDRDTIAIGEPVILTYDLPGKDASSKVDFTTYETVKNLLYKSESSMVDSLTVLERLDDDITWEDEKLSVKATIYDFGVYAIPYPIIDGEPLTGNQKILIVMPPEPVAGMDSIDIAPIKDILRESKSWKEYLWIGYLLVGLLLAWWLMRYLRKREKDEPQPINVEPQPVIDRRPAHVIALEELDSIDQQQLWKQETSKAFHSALTGTMRRYLDKRYDLNTLEMTTSETGRLLQKIDLSRDQMSTVEEVLNVADIVKFAKGESTTDLNRSFIEKARNFIIETKAEDLE